MAVRFRAHFNPLKPQSNRLKDRVPPVLPFVPKNTLNELRFAWIKRDLAFPENDPNSPTAGIGGLFTIGGASAFPQGRVQSTWQFQNIATVQRGRHSMKAGADIRYVQLENLAAFDTKGTFTFNNLQDYMNNVAVSFAQALQTASFDATQWNQSYFFQDDWRPTSGLTINLGLRYENSTVPFGLFGAEEQQVRDALVPGPARRDNNNWAPRVGFAWSPSPSGGLARTIFGDTTSSIRGGYGKTFDVLFYNILTVNGSNYPRVVVGRLDNATDVYPNLAPVSGVAVFDPRATFVNSPEDTESPESHLWSLSWQREVARQYVLEVGYTGSLGSKGIAQGQANYGVLTPAQAEIVRQTLSTTSIPTVQQRRLFPQFGSRVLITATSESEYHALYSARTACRWRSASATATRRGTVCVAPASKTGTCPCRSGSRPSASRPSRSASISSTCSIRTTTAIPSAT